MARVTGPLFSIHAAGKYGGALVFSRWKGRYYVRQLVTPSNPKSAMQVGVRAMMAFLATQWASLPTVAKASWDDLAASRSISAFNAFCSVNLIRWQSTLSPTQDNPASSDSSTHTITQTLTGASGMCTVKAEISDEGKSCWGVIICRDTKAITLTSWALCIALIPAEDASTVEYIDSPLSAGTYHYRCAAFDPDGGIGDFCVDASASVT